jgi:T-complex protein 1 subunit theta
MFQTQGGIQSLLKEGGRHFAGMDEALLKNIDAAKQIGSMTRSSFGPFGLNKLIVNHLDKHFVTRDAAVILEEMEVVHPAAQLVVMAAKAQEQECGDGTNLVTILAGELLTNAEELLKQGIHASDVIRGYELAIDGVVSELKKCKVLSVKNPRSIY